MRYQYSTAPAPDAAGATGHVVVIGGGIGGLGAALGLARAGHRVTVLDHDELASAPDAEAAFAAPRRGAPQVRQSHGLLARLTTELRARFPDVLDDLFAAGASELPLAGDLGATQPGDENLAVLLVRRTTLEWVLRGAAARQPHLTIRGGTRVVGLLADPATGPTGPTGPTGSSGPPRVIGVRLADGSALTADAVIASTGRRGAVPEWLAAVDVEVPEEIHDTNLLYLTRWYRLPDGAAHDLDPKLAGDLGFVKFLAIPCDGNMLSITIAVPTRDTRLRTSLLAGDNFDRAARRLPGPDAIFERFDPEPVSDVEPLGGLVNRLRHFVDDAGEPTVLGFHAIGDAHTCTNPFYGRGCSLALIQAGLLIDAFAICDGDDRSRSQLYEAGARRETEPWFHHSVTMDVMFKVGADPGGSGHGGSGHGAGGHAGERGGGRSAAADAGLQAVFAAGATDPVIGRALLRVFNMLEQPEDLGGDPVFLARVAEVVSHPDDYPLPVLEDPPTRDDFLATVSA